MNARNAISLFFTNTGRALPALLGAASVGVLGLLYPWPTLLAVTGVAAAGIAWHQPDRILLLLLATSPFHQALLGERAALRFGVSDVLMLAACMAYIPRVALRACHWSLGPMTWPILAFLAWSLLTAVLHFHAPHTLLAAAQMVQFTILCPLLFAYSPRSLRNVGRAFEIYAGVCSVVAILGIIGFAMGIQKGLYILGLHKNAVGAHLAMAVVILYVLTLSDMPHRRRRWLQAGLLLCVGGLIFSLSRGAWLGALAGILAVSIVSGQLGRLFRGLLLLIPLLFLCWRLLPAESAAYATSFTPDHHSIRERHRAFNAAWNLFLENPITGAGLGIREVHRDFNSVLLNCLAETGVPGLLLFLGIFAAHARLALRILRMLPSSSPYFLFVLMGLGVSAKALVHGSVDVYWGRGSITPQWAAIGLTIGIWRLVELGRARRFTASPLSPASDGHAPSAERRSPA